MSAYFAAGAAIVLSFVLIGVQIYRDGQNKPTPGWEVSSVETTTVYRMKAPHMKGYSIRHYSNHRTNPFRVMRWKNGSLVLDEYAESFVEAERIALKHAGVSLQEDPNQ